MLMVGLLSLGVVVLGVVLAIVACVRVLRQIPWVEGVEICYEQHQVRTVV